MIVIKPIIRNNICVTAHPLGCVAQVRAQIRYVTSREPIRSPRRVLVIGASNGYGLAARIVSAFASGAATLGVAYERPGRADRPASAGWYNSKALKQAAEAAGLEAWNVNGDAFSHETKFEVFEIIRKHLGSIDLLIYSIAAPRRIDPQTGDIYSSVIKPIGGPFVSKTVDFLSGHVKTLTAEPATDAEIAQTVKVMGGEDWTLWVAMLQREGLLAEFFRTITFSYIGPDLTREIYREGTIGRAKKDLEQTAARINTMLAAIGGQAVISVNKALVTRASAAIPAVPLYISLLYKAMKERGLHEGCIHQMYRLYHDHLFTQNPAPRDSNGRIRLDDWEMRPDVQATVAEGWARVTTENVEQYTDIQGFRDEFLHHHDFGMPGVDYSRAVDPMSVL
jgi:enoyl-[acyl-carrier protein] reductase/trans-2-enoyl-CoA reductase (NAD+)